METGRKDIVKHSLGEYALARFIRFVPTEYYGYKALRVEVLWSSPIYRYQFYFLCTLSLKSYNPSNLSHSEIIPDKPVGPKIKLTWHKPAEENGIIRSYTVFYSHNEDPHNIHTETLGGNILSYTVDVLGGATYQFHVRAATIKPGPNATLSVTVNDYGRCRSENIMIN